LAHALQLANEVAVFPQTCLCNDRLSAIEQWDLSETEAIDNETRRGIETLRSGETLAGAQRFTGGAGRGGKFE
jgi:enoyl-CoA hydratase